MKSNHLFGLILLAVGIALIVFGINHMNSTESQIKDFFGSEDTTGLVSAGIGAILVIFGGFVGLRKS